MKSLLKHPATDELAEKTYPAKFIGREGPLPSRQGEMVKWWFRVAVKKSFVDVSGITSTSFSTHPDCKGFKWARAIDLNLSEQSEDWDDEGAIGNECKVRITLVPGKDADFPTVAEVLAWDQPV